MVYCTCKQSYTIFVNFLELSLSDFIFVMINVNDVKVGHALQCSLSGLHANRVINSPYIDGISLAHGYPRKHIWSLLSGYSGIAASKCPCGSNTPYSVPSFVGSHYYCEAGCHQTVPSIGTFCL